MGHHLRHDLCLLESMDPAAILLVPVVVVVTAVVIFLHSLVLKFLSTAMVHNKVVVITDALTGLGKVIAETLEYYGCVDVLILNSSLKVKAPVQSTSLKMDKLVMDNNYFGSITVAKGFLPSMMSRRTGHVILVNSIQGKLAMPFRATYAASKHAVQAFFDCLRAEVQEYGISVSTVNHTFIISPPPGEKTKKSIWSIFSKQKFMGITPAEAASEILKILNSKKREVVMAHSLPKMAIYARSLFPNVFFAVMAAGVKNAAGVNNIAALADSEEL
ncbi:dehydrogenase/reductase SDR family member 7C-B-like [Oncorhynchus masou masou]|uniref:dehydrogenase/reductase SDR family member 7C-B-like n=1 Tax=Oncorhynchus masou masou TaxID=90313 RepID=UPI003182E82D